MLQILLGLLWAVITLFYLTLFSQKPTDEEKPAPMTNQLLDDGEPTNTEKEKEKEKDTEAQPLSEPLKEEPKKAGNDFSMYETNSFIYFHLYMAIMSIYLSMLLSNWGAVDFDSKNDQVSTNWWATSIKLSSGIIALLFYIWTLIAPAVFPGRNFG